MEEKATETRREASRKVAKKAAKKAAKEARCCLHPASSWLFDVIERTWVAEGLDVKEIRFVPADGRSGLPRSIQGVYVRQVYIAKYAKSASGPNGDSNLRKVVDLSRSEL